MPAVAGLFYPGDPDECARLASSFVEHPDPAPVDVDRLWGAVVPHAGWICSGAIAGQAMGVLAQRAAVELVVVFGAVHTPIDVNYAALDDHLRWETGGQTTDVAANVTVQLARAGGLMRVDARLHTTEHAVEVELPLIRAAWPDARLLPIEVPLIDQAVEIGQRTAAAVLGRGENVVFLASSDLTHYGPSYRFAPAGVGTAGLMWAKDNDRRLLDLVADMSAERIVSEVRAHRNACGGGAIAAMLSACRVAGARRAHVLRHANSVETLARVAPGPHDDAVGYAAVVVGS